MSADTGRAPSQKTSTSRTTLLVVEDDHAMRRVLRVSLEAQGYRVVEAATGRHALEQAAEHRPHVVVLDLGLPDLDGREVLGRLRAWTKVPVIVLSARDRESEKIAALDGGADDYVTKPFSTGELLARIRAAARHAAAREQPSEPLLTVGDLRIDLARRHAFARGERVHLSPKEYALFALMMKHAGHVLTHRRLLNEVWGADDVERVEYLRVHMAALRKKLEPDPTRPRYLTVEPGVGYRLRLPTDAPTKT